MTSAPEPELEIVRRGLWLGPAAFVAALLIGAVAGGWNIGWSAAIGIAVVFANFVVHGVSLARAARRSLTVLAAVAVGGFVVRLGAIVAIMFGLNRLAFFSPLAFGLAVIPGTFGLLAFEMKLLAGGLGAELRLPAQTEVVAR
ncbi:MAG TPA: hypothetical protein VF660_02330 [Actinomycetota bacterium]|jgi:hypothetical protein